jgi:hypothetical protein
MKTRNWKQYIPPRIKKQKNGCWILKQSCGDEGQPQAMMYLGNYKSRIAHPRRELYKQAHPHKKLTPFDWIVTSCHHKKCLNPRHLICIFSDQRMLWSGPKPRKLIPRQVRAIRRALKKGVRRRIIAEQYGIAVSMVWQIKNRKVWKNV